MGLDKSVLWTREQYEDYFQTVTRRILPKLDKKNIRPSYQNVGGYTAKNVINQQYSDGISGFSERDDFIYIKVKFLPAEEGSYIDADENIYMQRFIEITYTIYGANSSILALTLLSVLRTPDILDKLEKTGLYFVDSSKIENNREIINGAWWERNDFTFTVNECINVENPNKSLIASGYNDVEVIVK